MFYSSYTNETQYEHFAHTHLDFSAAGRDFTGDDRGANE
jgi:hypothetical protein